MTHNSANPKMETNTLKLNYELSQNIKIIFGTKAEFHFTFGHLSIPYSNPLTASHLTQKKKLKLFLWGVGIATIFSFFHQTFTVPLLCQPLLWFWAWKQG